MSEIRFSNMDESSLRNLLDKTIDMDERRLIRMAIRELRRCEIAELEAALTSKRFRRAQQRTREDKENHQCPVSSDSLERLSRRIQETRDIDELTSLLGSAGDYEERKLIRAAIRRLRDEEIRGTLEKTQTAHSEQRANPESSADLPAGKCGKERQESISQAEAHISKPETPENLKNGSDPEMVLVLDPLVKEKVTCPLTEQIQINHGSVSSEVIPLFTECSGSEESRHDSNQRKQLNLSSFDNSHACLSTTRPLSMVQSSRSEPDQHFDQNLKNLNIHNSPANSQKMLQACKSPDVTHRQMVTSI